MVGDGRSCYCVVLPKIFDERGENLSEIEQDKIRNCSDISKAREKSNAPETKRSRLGGRFEPFALFEIDLSVAGDVRAENRGSRRRPGNARASGHFVDIVVVAGRGSLMAQRRCQIQLGVVDLPFALDRRRP